MPGTTSRDKVDEPCRECRGKQDPSYFAPVHFRLLIEVLLPERHLKCMSITITFHSLLPFGYTQISCAGCDGGTAQSHQTTTSPASTSQSSEISPD